MNAILLALPHTSKVAEVTVMIPSLRNHYLPSFKIPSSPTSSSWLMNLMFEFSSKTQSCLLEKQSHQHLRQVLFSKIREIRVVPQNCFQKTDEDKPWRNTIRAALAHPPKAHEVAVTRV